MVALFAGALAFAPAATAAAPLDQMSAIRIAAEDPVVAATALMHPFAAWHATYEASAGVWLARLIDRSGASVASITINAETHRIISALVPGAPKTIDQATATRIANTSAKALDWVARYRNAHQQIVSQTSLDNGSWVTHWWANGAEIARVMVDPATGRITASYTGPQVAWSMARGLPGAFGRRINDATIFIPLLVVFLLGLADFRRVFSIRNLDLIVLASFAASLYYFNQGLVFWSVPLAYPPLIYLFCRMVVIGFGRRPRPALTSRWPVWLLAGLAIFALGFRAGLNFWSSNVIDVGYAGVVGADRLVHGHSPYGRMPAVTAFPCGPKYSDGSYSAYRQADGSCQSPVERGDTYGPVMYEAYVPFTAALGWTGRWDDLPAAHGTAVLFDALAAAGLMVAGLRLGGRRLAATALFFWAAYPFTTYTMSSNSNDAVVAAFIAWSIALFTFPFWRGFMLGLAAWAKFAPLLLIGVFLRADREPPQETPEWAFSAYGPGLIRPPSLLQRLAVRLRPSRGAGRVAAGLVAASLVAFGPLVVLDGIGAVHTFWTRTFGWQLDRPSPFSVWDWGIYPGFPGLGGVQTILKVALVGFAALVYVAPRRLDPARAAALGGALLVGFQLVLTHWFYLYIPWFVPCVAVALLAPLPGYARQPVAQAEAAWPRRRVARLRVAEA